MRYTRVNTSKLKTAISEAVDRLNQVNVLLDEYLELCTDEERASFAKPPKDFPPAARKLTSALGEHPEITAATAFDAASVLEDLENVNALDALDRPIARLQQLAADSRLAWLAEAYVASLQVYGVVRVRKDLPELQKAIEPLAAVFASRRGRKKKTED